MLADLFKLLWLRESVPTAKRAVLVVTELIVQALGGWVAIAAADLGIEVFVFDGVRVTPLRDETEPQELTRMQSGGGGSRNTTSVVSGVKKRISAWQTSNSLRTLSAIRERAIARPLYGGCVCRRQRLS